jgi:dehydrogenase/reductase SDR family protein 7B
VRLILAARRLDELKLVQEECRKKGADCISLYVDMASPATISEFVSTVSDQYQTLDILINNAGISQRSKAEETSIEVDRKIMEVNFFGQVALTKSLWPLLINSSHANIVNISSIVGTFGFSQRSAYSASKHALEGRIVTNISYSALKADGSSHQASDPGLENGITAEVCAQKIIRGIHRDQRKVYVVQKEMVMIILRKCIPSLFFRIAKNLKTV